MTELLHANKVIDSLNKDLKMNLKPSQRKLISEIKTNVTKSIKFSFANESLSIKDGLLIPEHLPFSEVYTELAFVTKTITKPITCGALVTEGESGYTIYLFSLTLDCVLLDVIINITREGITNVKGIKSSPDPTMSEAMIVIAKQFLHNFNILNCINIEYINNKPSKLKQSRVKNGKVKLFEHKTLRVKLSNKQNLNKGTGSHNSPRPHIRRGHIRRLQPGKSIWIQPCFINANEEGKITKDYLIG